VRSALLPIEQILPALRATLESRTAAVLVAAPGAGKTTRVPLALLDEPWLDGQKILMLEPRRIAARAAARYMAAQLGEPVGETVGYRVRLESRVGPRTRIEVVTEGVLTRMLQSDPALDGVGLVIFDEFHERSLQADLGLALALQSQSLLREDLRLLVMSATLEAEPVAALLGGAPVLVSEGRAFPVETRYLDRPVEGRIEPAVVRAIERALQEGEGDMLVFLPGAPEIRRVEALLAERGIGEGSGAGGGATQSSPRLRVLPLHGSLPAEAQDEAIAPSSSGGRKIVLATAIAETSLTVQGVRIVIDAGLMRLPRFSPRTGMTRLETLPVSRAAADQRRGRAGRLGPGVCYRLWTEAQDRQLRPQSPPEIREADLAPLALELAAWGADPLELAWLDPPPAPALAQARGLLRQLGALDEAGAITPHGQAMARAGLHPRLAHLVLAGIERGLGPLACDLAALLSERDLLGRPLEADLRLRLDALQGAGAGGYAVDRATRQRVLAEAAALRRTFRVEERSPIGALLAPADARAARATSHGAATTQPDACTNSPHPDPVGLLLAFAYPDRIAQRRSPGRFLLTSGRGAAFPAFQPLADEPYLVIAEIDDQGADGRIDLAAPIALDDLREAFADQIETEDVVAWTDGAVRARRRERLGALLLAESPLPNPAPALVQAALLQGIRQEGLGLLPWSKAARQLQERLVFLHRLLPDWPDATDEALLASLEDWLAPYTEGMRSKGDLQRLDLVEALKGLLDWPQRSQLDELAPTHITVPSGSRIPIDYSDPGAPVLAVRLQEVFGLLETPRIAGGRQPLLLHLLSPAHRPVQVTQDLASFWRGAYFEVRKDLRGRYPKHHWPEDPLAAQPTNRAKPRSQ
jgi:ATP-dependent helicase HrpB